MNAIAAETYGPYLVLTALVLVIAALGMMNAADINTCMQTQSERTCHATFNP